MAASSHTPSNLQHKSSAFVETRHTLDLDRFLIGTKHFSLFFRVQSCPVCTCTRDPFSRGNLVKV
jgi:hypothetical protein